jgi:hypothetical protein
VGRRKIVYGCPGRGGTARVRRRGKEGETGPAPRCDRANAVSREKLKYFEMQISEAKRPKALDRALNLQILKDLLGKMW